MEKKKSFYTNGWFWFLIVLVIFVIICMLFGTTKDNTVWIPVKR